MLMDFLSTGVRWRAACLPINHCVVAAAAAAWETLPWVLVSCV